MYAQVTVFTGKAAVPLGGIFGFQKAFFLHPETDELYGRVQLQKGPLGNALYPLYYRASVEASIVAGTTVLAFAWSTAHFLVPAHVVSTWRIQQLSPHTQATKQCHASSWTSINHLAEATYHVSYRN